MKKILEKSGNFVRGKKWEHCRIYQLAYTLGIGAYIFNEDVNYFLGSFCSIIYGVFPEGISAYLVPVDFSIRVRSFDLFSLNSD